jgi:acyl-CoA thioester hydrolase
MSAERPTPAPRGAFSHFYTLPTRWADNDIYGHVNNVVYYAYFDTAVNRYLIEEGGLQPGADTVVGYVVNSSADYFQPITHPAELQLGLAVVRLGGKSVTWEVGVFLEGDTHSRVTGRFTHAFVDRNREQSAAIPAAIHAAIERLC